MRRSPLPLALSLVGLVPPLHAWPSQGHSRITEEAIKALPREEQEFIGPERHALVHHYCHFPDINWACYGEWGGGVGDPRKGRLPDVRREWEVSFYCLYDPVLRKGKFYSHAPPDSYECTPIYFTKAVEALRRGRFEDGMRFLGVMLHYIQDSGSFPHLQPIHRHSGVDLRGLSIEGYSPRLLCRSLDEAEEALSKRVRELVRWTEGRMAPLLEGEGLSMAEAKRLCGRDIMHPKVVEAVRRILSKRRAEFESAMLDCAEECARACADALHTALHFAPRPRPEPPPNPPHHNLAFNPSFESDNGDGVPDGWCVGWINLRDKAGRASWYRAGTHWERHVKEGQFSILLLWAPEEGLEWRQTWRRATRVREGERYKLSVWAEAKGATGRNFCALEFYDASYKPLGRAESPTINGDKGWTELSVEAEVPEGARWMRIILRSEGNEGAVWFDCVNLVKVK